MKKLTVIYLLSSILLSGCASDCPYVEDSPKSVSNLALCKDMKSLKTIGTSCRVQVCAGDFETNVGLTVEQYEEYKVLVPTHQVWYDSTNGIIPLCGIKGSPTMNLFYLLKRQKDALWFSVIAEVKSADNKSTYDLCKAADNLSEKSAKFKVMNNGKLIMYPNDSVGFYGNNRGKIWLEIQRLK